MLYFVNVVGPPKSVRRADRIRKCGIILVDLLKPKAKLAYNVLLF